MYYLSFILFCCVNCSDSELSEVVVVVVVVGCFSLLEVEGQRAHWEQGGRGALGETTHNPSAGAVCMSETYLQQREVGKSFQPPCQFLFSLFFKTLSWSQLRAPS